jgi:hypothetical protein
LQVLFSNSPLPGARHKASFSECKPVSDQRH